MLSRQGISIPISQAFDPIAQPDPSSPEEQKRSRASMAVTHADKMEAIRSTLNPYAPPFITSSTSNFRMSSGPESKITSTCFGVSENAVQISDIISETEKLLVSNEQSSTRMHQIHLSKNHISPNETLENAQESTADDHKSEVEFFSGFFPEISTEFLDELLYANNGDLEETFDGLVQLEDHDHTSDYLSSANLDEQPKVQIHYQDDSSDAPIHGNQVKHNMPEKLKCQKHGSAYKLPSNFDIGDGHR